MIIVDNAMRERLEARAPIRVGLIGAGFSASIIAYQILKSFPAIHLVAIANRTVDRARHAYLAAGIEQPRIVESAAQLENVMSEGGYAITQDPRVVCEATGVDAIIEATGTIEYGAAVVSHAIECRKAVILMNVELDATLGPMLKSQAENAQVIYTNSDGDEPGVAMNLFRFVKSIGLRPVVAGNLKGFYDRYRTPETQSAFARLHNQKPKAIASFADGTKLSMELTVLANATGFGVGKRGMHGPNLHNVKESAEYFSDKLLSDGIVDFLVGATPANGAFVIGHSEDPVHADYLKYLKMGEGPLYVFYTPFHLPQLEIPNTVARAVLFRDATVAPRGAPVCDAISVAKHDLKAGDTLDGLGGFACYALIDDYQTCRRQGLLPIGVSEGCRLKRNIRIDQTISYDDVVLPNGRISDCLRADQERHFNAIG